MYGVAWRGVEAMNWVIRSVRLCWNCGALKCIIYRKGWFRQAGRDELPVA